MKKLTIFMLWHAGMLTCMILDAKLHIPLIGLLPGFALWGLIFLQTLVLFTGIRMPEAGGLSLDTIFFSVILNTIVYAGVLVLLKIWTVTISAYLVSNILFLIQIHNKSSVAARSR